MARGGANHSNGRLFRILTGSPEPIVSVIFSWCAEKAKTAVTLYSVTAAVFLQQKITGSVLADPSVFPHLSSSPDLRFFGFVRPSQISPMTGFRLARTSTHTVAVPSGILTRLSILLRCCYRIHRHFNGIFTYPYHSIFQPICQLKNRRI